MQPRHPAVPWTPLLPRPQHQQGCRWGIYKQGTTISKSANTRKTYQEPPQPSAWEGIELNFSSANNGIQPTKSNATLDDDAAFQKNLVRFHCQASDKCQTAKRVLNRSDLRNTGGFTKKAALTLEPKSYFLTALGGKSQLPFPPPQQDRAARRSARPAPQDARVRPSHGKAVRRGVWRERGTRRMQVLLLELRMPWRNSSKFLEGTSGKAQAAPQTR